jgi:hypothetical protein
VVALEGLQCRDRVEGQRQPIRRLWESRSMAACS